MTERIRSVKSPRDRAYLVSVIFLFLTVLETAEAVEVSYLLERTILNPEPTHGANFGSRMCRAGDSLVLVGARGSDVSLEDAGAAYLFDVDTGNLVHTFRNPDPDRGDQFGVELAWDGGNFLFVSSHLDDTMGTDSGLVYVFSKSTGLLVHTLISPTPTQGGWFGVRIRPTGGKVFIGATGDHVQGVRAGVVHVYDTSNWEHTLTIPNPDPESGDRFGWDFSPSDDEILVSSYLESGAPGDSGSAYLFNQSTGNLLQTFSKEIPQRNDSFGGSTALVGDHVFVGAIDDDAKGSNSGAVYVFEKTSGELENSIYGPSPRASQRLGVLFHLCDRLFLGGQGVAGRGLQGRAYEIDPSTGQSLFQFINPNAGPDDFFGAGITAGKDWTAVSSFADDRGAFASGAVFIYRREGQEQPTPTPTSLPEGVGLVAGYIISASDFLPVTESVLALGNSIIHPDEDGFFLFEGVRGGTQRLEAVSPGFEPNSLEIAVEGAEVLLVEMLPRGTNPNADTNFDGVVNNLDYLELQKNWHRRFPGRVKSLPMDSHVDRRIELLKQLETFASEKLLESDLD